MPSRRTAAAQAAPSVTATFTMPPTTPAEPLPIDETKPDFWDYIQQLTPEQWKRHIVYLTRENPKTSINGMGGYLTKLQQPFDQDDIKSAFGGYEFSYILKEDSDICKKCRNASGKIRIEAPPKYDPQREAATNPAPASSNGHNDSTAQLLQQFVGVLRDELARSREGRSDSAGEEAIRMLSSASEKAMEVITKQIPQAGDPASQLTALLAAAEKIAAMRAPAPAAAGGLGELGALLIPLLKPLLERLIAPVDPLDQLSKLAGVLDVVEKIRGNGGGSGKNGDWKTALVEEGVPAVKELVGALAEQRKAAIEGAREARLRAEAQERATANVRDINAQRNAASVAPHAANAPAPAPAAAPPPPPVSSAFRVVPIDGAAPEPAPATTPTAANADEYLKGVKVRFCELLAAGEDVDFIVDFLDGAVPKFVEQIRTYSAEQITAFFKTDPILARLVSQPGWAQWLENAKEYLAADEDPAPAPIKPN